MRFDVLTSTSLYRHNVALIGSLWCPRLVWSTTLPKWVTFSDRGNGRQPCGDIPWIWGLIGTTFDARHSNRRRVRKKTNGVRESKKTPSRKIYVVEVCLETESQTKTPWPGVSNQEEPRLGATSHTIINLGRTEVQVSMFRPSRWRLYRVSVPTVKPYCRTEERCPWRYPVVPEGVSYRRPKILTHKVLSRSPSTVKTFRSRTFDCVVVKTI